MLKGEPSIDAENDEGSPSYELPGRRRSRSPTTRRPAGDLRLHRRRRVPPLDLRLWRQVLDYFDAFLIGLTATPNKQAFGFFNQNLVMEYNHEQAVADGVNVDYDVYRIRTEITEQGRTIEAGLVTAYPRRGRRARSRYETARRRPRLHGQGSRPLGGGQGPDPHRHPDLPGQALHRDFPRPHRDMVPKTLIFAKDDSHADDIVHIVREEFGKGNDFARRSPTDVPAKDSDELISEFRNSPELRIAVTVDMIATGTDIKPLECLLFMRDVRSRSYFEQMMGRGVRVINDADFRAVTPDATSKERFVVVDAVGVTERDRFEDRTQPLDRKPTVA